MAFISSIKTYLLNKKLPIPTYYPNKKTTPQKTIEIRSAWKGLEFIIEDILDQFDIGRDSCIEFGVEFGYSTVVFSNYFNQVYGIDLFTGDQHTKHKGDHFEKTKNSLSEFENIKLFKSDYKTWIEKDERVYDFAHVDIIHNYKETYECGLWAVQHSKCCIFHDTESFPEVRRAVIDIARDTGKNIYNYPYSHGLAIIV